MNHFIDRPILLADITYCVRRRVKKEVTANCNINTASYGTNHVRCAALAMHLAGYSVVDIMLKDRRSSEAFILYVKRAVLERSSGTSERMVLADSLTIFPTLTLASVGRSNTSLSCKLFCFILCHFA